MGQAYRWLCPPKSTALDTGLSQPSRDAVGPALRPVAARLAFYGFEGPFEIGKQDVAGTLCQGGLANGLDRAAHHEIGFDIDFDSAAPHQQLGFAGLGRIRANNTLRRWVKRPTLAARYDLPQLQCLTVGSILPRRPARIRHAESSGSFIPNAPPRSADLRLESTRHQVEPVYDMQ